MEVVHGWALKQICRKNAPMRKKGGRSVPPRWRQHRDGSATLRFLVPEKGPAKVVASALCADFPGRIPAQSFDTAIFCHLEAKNWFFWLH